MSSGGHFKVMHVRPINPPQAVGVDRGALVFIRAVGDRVLVYNQNPLESGVYDNPAS